MPPRRAKKTLVTLTVWLVLLLAPPVLAQQRDWQGEWNQLVAAGRKEGTVVVVASPDAVMRKELPAKFKARFGITVEYLGIRGGDAQTKLRMERQAGFSTIDIVLGGAEAAALLYQEKMLDPIRPVLILPEVLDRSKWKKGDLWFIDPENQYILRLINYLTHLLHINTRHVKPEELKSARDLLNPKWMGKISSADPTLLGAGSTTAAMFYREQGEEFVKQLYINQKPFIGANTEQLADSLARGTYPISFDARGSSVERFRDEGFPLVSFTSLSDQQGRTTAGGGLVGLVNKAPHPNAARVFLNWITSKEGMEVYSRARMLPMTRNDLDESFVPQELLPRPGVTYFDATNWDFLVVEHEKIRLRVKKILGR